WCPCSWASCSPTLPSCATGATPSTIPSEEGQALSTTSGEGAGGPLRSEERRQDHIGQVVGELGQGPCPAIGGLAVDRVPDGALDALLGEFRQRRSRSAGGQLRGHFAGKVHAQVHGTL